VAVRTLELGQDDPDTVKAMSWSAMVVGGLGRPEDAGNLPAGGAFD
jgi:hypothetical protein